MLPFLRGGRTVESVVGENRSAELSLRVPAFSPSVSQLVAPGDAIRVWIRANLSSGMEWKASRLDWEER
jgi:hypothetical protein